MCPIALAARARVVAISLQRHFDWLYQVSCLNLNLKQFNYLLIHDTLGGCQHVNHLLATFLLILIKYYFGTIH